MNPLTIFGPEYNPRQLSPYEEKAGNNVFSQCFNARKGEKILIVTDEAKKDTEAAIFFQTAKKFTDQVTLAVIPPLPHHGAEPPPDLTSLLLQQNIVLLVTTFSLSHTYARKQASDSGVRIASLPGISKEIITRTLNIDYSQVAHLAKRIAGLLTMADRARLTTPTGTDVSFSLAGRQGWADTGLFTNPGDFGNLPAGEAFTAPVEGQTRGVAIFDGAFGDMVIDEPIKVTFSAGQASKIEGGTGAKNLEIMLNSLGQNTRSVAELGVGTNKNAKLESSLVEVEKVYGTCHIAIGNNKHIGGQIDAPYHADGVILKPTLILDDKIVVKDGQFV